MSQNKFAQFLENTKKRIVAKKNATIKHCGGNFNIAGSGCCAIYSIVEITEFQQICAIQGQKIASFY